MYRIYVMPSSLKALNTQWKALRCIKDKLWLWVAVYNGGTEAWNILVCRQKPPKLTPNFHLLAGCASEGNCRIDILLYVT